MAAKAATRRFQSFLPAASIPIRLGLVTSFNRPTGNVTGVSQFSNCRGEATGVMRELFLKPAAIALLVNPDNAAAEAQFSEQ